MIKKFWKSASGRKVFLLGLALGFVVTSSAMYWFGKAMLDSEEYEADASAHLGLRSDMLPIVALRPISTDRITRHLKIKSSEESLKLARVFADRIAAGFLPKGWDQRCAKEYHPMLCMGIADYFTAFEARTASRKRISRRTRLVLSEGRAPQLQKEDLGALLAIANKQPRTKLQSWTNAALKTPSCPRNFSIALARMWEFHTDAPGAWEKIASLDKHGLECLEADETNGEYVLMRAGLLAYVAKDFSQAEEYFSKALASTARRESYRVNFWMVKTLDALGRAGEARDFRERILIENPLSWQAIRTYSELGRDPMEMVRTIKPFRDRYYSDDEKLNQRLSWLYLMARIENSEYAVQRYTELMVSLMDGSTPRGVFQHVARILDGVSQHQLQISTLTRMFNVHSDAVNVETLRLYYPKPYFDEIDTASPTLDTSVLLGLVRQESGFNPKARSGANARGLLQVLPSTARDIRRRTPAEQLYDSSTNIQIGSAYFRRLVSYFDGSFEKSLAAYNAGMGRVRDWERRYSSVATETQLFMDLIPYRETREYVSSILRNAYWYHRLFPELTLALRDGLETPQLLRQELAQQISGYVPASEESEPNSAVVERDDEAHSDFEN